MTYKQIEASREVRQAIASIARNAKESITEKVKKIKEKK